VADVGEGGVEVVDTCGEAGVCWFGVRWAGGELWCLGVGKGILLALMFGHDDDMKSAVG